MALSSGALPAGVAVIRLSGPRVQEALHKMAGGSPRPRQLALRKIGAGQMLDQGLVVPHTHAVDSLKLAAHLSDSGVEDQRLDPGAGLPQVHALDKHLRVVVVGIGVQLRPIRRRMGRQKGLRTVRLRPDGVRTGR